MSIHHTCVTNWYHFLTSEKKVTPDLHMYDQYLPIIHTLGIINMGIFTKEETVNI